MLRTTATLLIWLLPLIIALPTGAQEPPPEAPPEEAQPQEPTVEPSTEEPDEEPEPVTEGDTEDASATDDVGSEEQVAGEEGEAELTPKEEEAQQKAAEQAAKREERRAKRAEKLATQEVKQLEKVAHQEEKTAARVAELRDLGYAAIEAEKYNNAKDHFQKIKELEGGKSFAGQMGLAHIQLAHSNYAQAIQLAQLAVKATKEKEEKAQALTFAGNTTLAARPRIDDGSGRPQPGTEMFLDTALRFFIRAIALAPAEATEARARLEERFPGGPPDEHDTRMLQHYVGLVENGEIIHGRRVAAAYEALLAGRPAGNTPVAAIPPLTPPKRLTGVRPTFTAEDDRPTRRRLIVGITIADDGTVSRVEVLNGIHRGQDNAAVAALLEWTFEPARLPNGTPVTAYWLQGVTVSPRLDDNSLPHQDAAQADQ